MNLWLFMLNRGVAVREVPRTQLETGLVLGGKVHINKLNRGKGFLKIREGFLLSECKGTCCGKVFQAVGVAVPRTF